MKKKKNDQISHNLPPSTNITNNKMITSSHVHIDQSLKTPQFYLLWSNLFCNVTAGIAVIGLRDGRW